MRNQAVPVRVHAVEWALLYTVVRVLGINVKPGSKKTSCVRDTGGELRYTDKQMQAAVLWGPDFRDDLVCEELGITWEPVESFTSAGGELRSDSDRAKWEEFTTWYENTPTYVSKGWPWPHPGTANDKQVLLVEDTPKWQFLKAQPTSCLSDEGRVAKEKRPAGKRPRDESEVYWACAGRAGA